MAKTKKTGAAGEKPPLQIEVGVYYYEDENGIPVFDEEEMRREFENKLGDLMALWGGD